jgi:bifunctional UDP-N-acetylglucosamine pyrophosphorylase / glucosamine-1-phosphate N-acetyltransferase
MKDTKVGAIIPAGGYGTLDGTFCKLGAWLGGQPMIIHVVSKVLSLRREQIISDICIVLNDRYKAEICHVLRQYLPQEYDSLKFALQQERCGAAGAVELALREIPTAEKIFVTFGDMPLWRTETMTRLITEHHRVSAGAEFAFSMVTLNVPSGHNAWKYGRVLYRDGQIVAIIEPKNSRLTMDELARSAPVVNPSLYVFQRDFLDQHLSRLPLHDSGDGFALERNLPDLVRIAHEVGKPIHQIPLQDAHEALGVNTQEELDEVQLVLDSRRNAG